MVKKHEDAYRKTLLKSFKGNSKKFYGFMRNLQTNKSKVSELTKKDGLLTQTEEETAQVLSSYFSSVFVREPGESGSNLRAGSKGEVLTMVDGLID